MVKGVNKTVIEVNDTGSKFFEKIVFYVSPQYGNLNAKDLKKAASELSLGLDSYSKKSSLRKRMIIKRRIFIFSAALSLFLCVAGIVLFLILWIVCKINARSVLSSCILFCFGL